MSADNGVILRKTRLNFYEVITYSGDYSDKGVTFADSDDALEYISENCNGTEYGITLTGFEEKTKDPIKEGFEKHFGKLTEVEE